MMVWIMASARAHSLPGPKLQPEIRFFGQAGAARIYDDELLCRLTALLNMDPHMPSEAPFRCGCSPS
jgi:hypothetical protein